MVDVLCCQEFVQGQSDRDEDGDADKESENARNKPKAADSSFETLVIDGLAYGYVRVQEGRGECNWCDFKDSGHHVPRLPTVVH